MVKTRNENLGFVHNKFKFLGVSGTLDLDVTNTPGMAKVPGLNLTGLKNSVKKCRLIICLLKFG